MSRKKPTPKETESFVLVCVNCDIDCPANNKSEAEEMGWSDLFHVPDATSYTWQGCCPHPECKEYWYGDEKDWPAETTLFPEDAP